MHECTQSQFLMSVLGVNYALLWALLVWQQPVGALLTCSGACRIAVQAYVRVSFYYHTAMSHHVTDIKVVGC